MSSRATRKSASAGKSQGTASSNAPLAETSIGRKERRAEIGQTVSQAMKSLSAKRTMDWTRETPEISAAQAVLDETMTQYVEGTATREDVKKAYRTYADLHIVEKGT